MAEIIQGIFIDPPIAIARLGQGISALEAWRTTHFGSAGNTGTGADANDADGDGLANLAEYGFGLQPLIKDANLQPAWIAQADGTLSLSFPVRPFVTAFGEMSPSMAEGSWTAMPDTGAPGMHLYRASIGAGHMFFRTKFITP